MHAGWNGRTQIWSGIVWLLCWNWWNGWSNAANGLISTHIADRGIVQCHVLVRCVLIVLWQRTSTLELFPKMRKRRVLIICIHSRGMQLMQRASIYLVRVVWWIVCIRRHVANIHAGQWKEACNVQTTWSIHWSGCRLSQCQTRL